MNALKLDALSAPDGTLTFRLPQPGRFLVHVEATWEPVEVDRKAIFEEIRRRGDPMILQILDQLGEEGIANPEMLLLAGSIDDPTLERPPQPPLVERDPIE